MTKKGWAILLNRAAFLIFSLPMLVSFGCGYTFQNSHNALYLKEDVQKIWVAPIVNATFKPGIENQVYNHLVRTLVAHKKVTLVQNIEEADAILSGTVGGASYGGSAGTAVSSLYPTPLGGSLPTAPYTVFTEYVASLSCSFSLSRIREKPGKTGYIWSAGFSRSKPFPGANQLDIPGTTSPLINESEFDRALLDLVRSMMDDVHESMVAMF